MSWKSQQGYTLGFFLNEPTTAVAGIGTGVNTTIYTSPPLPAGMWVVALNGIDLTGTITQSVLGAFVDGIPVANCGVVTDVIVFSSLAFVVGSDGTTVVEVDVYCESVGTWDVGAGIIQLARLTI